MRLENRFVNANPWSTSFITFREPCFFGRPLHTPLSDSLKWTLSRTSNLIKFYVTSCCVPEMRLLVTQISS